VFNADICGQLLVPNFDIHGMSLCLHGQLSQCGQYFADKGGGGKF